MPAVICGGGTRELLPREKILFSPDSCALQLHDLHRCDVQFFDSCEVSSYYIFWLDGRGHLQDDATPTFSPDF